jgi:hypothetical protein
MEGDGRRPVTDTPSTAEQETRAFTQALFGNAPKGLHALLWTLQDLHSTWLPADDPDKIAATALSLAKDQLDVYVAVSLAATLPPPGRQRAKQRIAAEDSAGIFGLWADIDIAEADVHQKFNLPPDEKSAMELLEAAGVEPTLIVHSGHGLQAWWLWHEPWLFDNERDRLAAASLAERWHSTLRVRAAEQNWTVDSVFDLARVFRVPGTVNRKGLPAGKPALPVRLLRDTGQRYNPDDFEPFCVDESVLVARGLTPTRSYQPDALDLTDGMAPPADKFNAALANDEKFKQSWERKRPPKDLPDQSPSAYDMSLASLAVGYGWSDQEIAQLIYAFRRQHKLDLQKALDARYIGRTIARARTTRQADLAAESADEVIDALAEARATGDDDDVRTARRAALKVISDQLGIEVLHLIKFVANPATYQIITPTHRIDVPSTEALLDWRRLKTAIYEQAGHQITRMNTTAWDRLTAVFPQVWESQDLGREATDEGRMESYLAAYLEARPPVDSKADAFEMEQPLYDEQGRIVIIAVAFRRYILQHMRDRMTDVEFGLLMRKVGAVPHTVAIPAAAKRRRSTKSAWILPDEWTRPTGPPGVRILPLGDADIEPAGAGS